MKLNFSAISSLIGIILMITLCFHRDWNVPIAWIICLSVFLAIYTILNSYEKNISKIHRIRFALAINIFYFLNIAIIYINKDRFWLNASLVVMALIVAILAIFIIKFEDDFK